AQNTEEISEFNELPEGPFKDYILYVSQNLVEDEEYEGEIVYYPTLEIAHQYLSPDERSPRSRATLIGIQLRPLRKAFELPLKTVGARSTRRQLADESTIYISASYLYASLAEQPEKRKRYQDRASTIRR